MNKLSTQDRSKEKERLDDLSIDKDDWEEWRRFHIDICNLSQNSPYEMKDTSQLLSVLRSRANDIREALMRGNIDIENDRGIPEGRITRKEIALEGHKTILYRNPADGLIYLFREGDGEHPYLTFKDGRIKSITSPGLQSDGSIRVVYKSDEHRALRKQITMFRGTSIDPDDEDDGGSDPTPPLIAPVETIEKELV